MFDEKKSTEKARWDQENNHTRDELLQGENTNIRLVLMLGLADIELAFSGLGGILLPVFVDNTRSHDCEASDLT